MGNTSTSGSNPNTGYKIKLGTLCSMSVSEITSTTNKFGEVTEKQSVIYKVYGRECTLTLNKTIPPGGYTRGQKLNISISDLPCSAIIEVQITEDGQVVVPYGRARFLWKPRLSLLGNYLPNFMNLTSKENLIIKSTADGGITETCIIHSEDVFTNLNAKVLLVLQKKKKGWDQSPYMVSVAHYFVQTSFIDCGISLVANIHGEEGLKLEGPKLHPATALYQVFEEAKRSECWNPNACSHCPNVFKQRQPQSDRENENSNVAVTTFAADKSLHYNNNVAIGDGDRNGNGSTRFFSEKMELYFGGKTVYVANNSS